MNIKFATWILAAVGMASFTVAQPAQPEPAQPEPGKLPEPVKPAEPAKQADPKPAEVKPIEPTKPAEKPKPAEPYVLAHTVKDIDGHDVPLTQYKGKVVLIVNVASKCGFTPQYEGLEKLYQEYKSRGFVVLGFPANNFGGQEPGSESEIKAFCASKYGVTFPMFAKVSVKGADATPLYQQLAGQGEGIGGEPKWNFTKFLLDREGRVVARYEPRTKPDDSAMKKKISDLLGGEAATPPGVKVDGAGSEKAK